jgi:hypothetical protein
VPEDLKIFTPPIAIKMSISAILGRWWPALIFSPGDTPIMQSSGKDQAPEQPFKQSSIAPERPSWRLSNMTSNGLSPTRPAGRKRSRTSYFSILDGSSGPRSPPTKKVRFDMVQKNINEIDKSKSAIQRLGASGARRVVKTQGSGSEYFVSGALPSFGPRRADTIYASDDASVARSDLRTAMNKMPFKIVNPKELRELQLFRGRFPEEDIGTEYKTTFLGIQRALEETNTKQESQDAGDLSYDEILVYALEKRAGYFMGDDKVQQVEDLVAFVTPEDEEFDEEYWARVWSKKTFWRELSKATRDAIKYGKRAVVEEPENKMEFECDNEMGGLGDGLYNTGMGWHYDLEDRTPYRCGTVS